VNEKFFDNPLGFVDDKERETFSSDLSFTENENVFIPENPTPRIFDTPSSHPVNAKSASVFGGKSSGGPFGLNGLFGNDGLILLGLIFLLFYEDKEKNQDTIILLAVLFLAGILF